MASNINVAIKFLLSPPKSFSLVRMHHSQVDQKHAPVSYIHSFYGQTSESSSEMLFKFKYLLIVFKCRL